MAITDLIGGLANPFGAPSKGSWNLNNASFRALEGDTTEIVFFTPDPSKQPRDQRVAMENAQDNGGRRLAIYEYPYRDGQDIDDLGRKGEVYTFQITFFGKSYRQRYDAFRQTVIQNRARGILTHPIYGQVSARLRDYDFIHSHDKWNSVALRVSFIEDNTDSLQGLNNPAVSTNSALRSALSFLSQAQGVIGNGIFQVGALLLLPSAIQNAQRLRLASITGALSRLLGQMVSTFSSDAQLKALASKTGSFLASSIGTTTDGEILPAVFQVGVSPDEAALVTAQQDAYINAAQITPLQLAYQMNQIRGAISEAIAEIEDAMSTDGFELVQAYRELAVQFQYAVESAIASAQSTIVYYSVPFDMSIRRVAFLNGLSADRGNDISLLNPDLESANFVPRGTLIAVPAQ